MNDNNKPFQVFNSGLSIQIFNRPVQDNYLWDDKIFWRHMEFNGKKEICTCNEQGFYNLEDCMDDCIKYIKNFKDDKNENSRTKKTIDKLRI